MRCMNCDAEINSKDKFCENCGTSIEESIAYNKKIAEDSKKEKKETKDTKEKVAEILNAPVPKKKKNHRVLIIALVVALLACLGAAYYFFIYKTPKKAFTKVIDQFTDSLTENLDSSVKSEKGKVRVQAKVDMPSYDYSLNQVIDIINDMNFIINYEVDKDKKIFNYDFIANYEGEKLIGIEGAMNEYNIYYRFDDSQKYIKQKLEEGQNIFKYFDDVDEAKKIITGLADALKDSLDEEYMESESAKITVDGKEVSTTKNTLLLNKENTIAIIKAYIDSISENDDLMDTFSKSADMNKDQFVATLNMVKANVSEYIGEMPLIKVSVYTKGFSYDFVRLEIELEGQTIAITKTDDETYTFTVLGQKLGYIKIKGDKNDKEVEINFGYMDMKFNLSIKSTVENNVKVNEKDIYSYINSEDVTDYYYTSLLNKLNNNKAFRKLYNYISGYSNSYYLYD